jgi:hypothetical protein
MGYKKLVFFATALVVVALLGSCGLTVTKTNTLLEKDREIQRIAGQLDDCIGSERVVEVRNIRLQPVETKFELTNTADTLKIPGVRKPRTQPVELRYELQHERGQIGVIVSTYGKIVWVKLDTSATLLHDSVRAITRVLPDPATERENTALKAENKTLQEKTVIQKLLEWVFLGGGIVLLIILIRNLNYGRQK